MNDRTEATSLDEVLDAYFTDAERPDPNTLARWIKRYPEFERELSEFTVAWSRTNHLEPVAPPSDQAVLRRWGMSVLQDLLQREGITSRGSDTEPLASIIAAGKTLHLTLDDIADRTDMSPSLVWEIDRRLFAYASIPLEAIEALAHAIHASVVSIARHLRGAPLRARGASYKATQAPAVAAQRDFFEGVRDASDLSEQRRERWLALAPSRD